MKRLLTLLLFGIGLSGIASAQSTTITASNIADVAHHLLTGQFCVQPAQQFVRSGGGNVIPIQVCFPVTNGVLISGVSLADTSMTNPVNVCYKVIIENPVGFPMAAYPCMQPVGSTFSFDNFVSASPAISTTALVIPQFFTNDVLNTSQTELDIMGTSPIVVTNSAYRAYISCPTCGSGGGGTGPTGATGATGAAGPNSVSGSTTTAFNGLLGANGSDVIQATISQVNTLLQSATGCTTVGYVYSPQSGTCIAGGSGGGNTTSTSLTNNKVPKASGANAVLDSSISDNGTTVSTPENVTAGGSVTAGASAATAYYHSTGPTTSAAPSVVIYGSSSDGSVNDYYWICGPLCTSGNPVSAPSFLPSVVTGTGTTPVINVLSGSFKITLSGNTTPTVTGIQTGVIFSIQICQPSTVYTWTWPSLFHGAWTIGATANTCSMQMFQSFNGTDMVAISSGINGVTP